MYSVPARILYLQRYWTDFRKLRLSSNMLRVDIWVDSFRCAGILLLQWQGEDFAPVNIWYIATFNMYSVPAKILYLQRYSTDFRNLCISSKVLRVGIWVDSVRCAVVLLLQWQGENFAHRHHLKFCHFQHVYFASKNPISPRYWPNFRNLCFSSKMLRVGIWVESLRNAGILFCNGKVKTLRIDNIWNFATFNMCTLPAKILYLQRYWTNFRNLCFSSKILRVGIWVESVRYAGISKVLNQFSKSLLQLEDVEGGHLGGKSKGAQVFYFAMARWKLCALTTFEILQLLTCTLCQQKSYISKGIQPILEIFPSARRRWGCAFGWITSDAQVFCFCNGKVKTLRIDNIWNFATFNMYTVPGKILYLQGHSSDFRNLCFSSKMLTVDIWVESFRCAGILLLQWQGENLRIHNIWNFATFNLYTVAAKILYLQRYSTDFRNLSLSSKMLRVCIWVESFRCAGILLLQWQGEKFSHRQHLKFCHFQLVHCASKNPISPQACNRFSKSLPQLEDVEGGNSDVKFQVRRYFTFAMAMWKLCASKTYEILPLLTCTLCQQKSYISKGIQPIFEIFPSARS